MSQDAQNKAADLGLQSQLNKPQASLEEELQVGSSDPTLEWSCTHVLDTSCCIVESDGFYDILQKYKAKVDLDQYSNKPVPRPEDS